VEAAEAAGAMEVEVMAVAVKVEAVAV